MNFSFSFEIFITQSFIYHFISVNFISQNMYIKDKVFANFSCNSLLSFHNSRVCFILSQVFADVQDINSLNHQFIKALIASNNHFQVVAFNAKFQRTNQATHFHQVFLIKLIAPQTAPTIIQILATHIRSSFCSCVILVLSRVSLINPKTPHLSKAVFHFEPRDSTCENRF
ncbi:MAG: hypothetical protein ACOZBL_02120 [Patescibacteria group bacterium]